MDGWIWPSRQQPSLPPLWSNTGMVACLHAQRAGRRHPKGRRRDFESRALVAMPAGVTIVWMKAHQSDRDAEEGRVQLFDLQGSCMVDAAANN
eukprot:10868-Amphidinium_carterae.1